MPTSAKPSFVFLNPDPSIADNPNTIEIDLGDFLAVPIHSAAGQTITIKGINKYCANVSGGTHKGLPRKKDNADLLHATANQIWLNGKQYPLESLRTIIRITIPALLPLYARLRA